MKFSLATLVIYFLVCLITAQDYEAGNTKSGWSSKGGSSSYTPRRQTLENAEPATQLMPESGNRAVQTPPGPMFQGTYGSTAARGGAESGGEEEMRVPGSGVPGLAAPAFGVGGVQGGAPNAIGGGAFVPDRAAGSEATEGGGEERVREPGQGAPSVVAPGFGVGGVFGGVPRVMGGGAFHSGRPAPPYDDGNYSGSRKTLFGKGRRWRGPRCSVEPPHEECTGGITMWFYDPENKTCAAHEVGNCFKLGFFFCRACVASCMGIFWRRREIQEICQLAD